LFDKIKELYLLNIYKIANCADCLLPTANWLLQPGPASCKLPTANCNPAPECVSLFYEFHPEIVNKTNQYEKEK
jgi:hypothetical protein